MNSAVSAAGGVVNDALVEVLAGYASFPAIGEGVAALAGCDPVRLADPAHPVLGYLIRPEEIFTAWLATPSGFNVFELSRAGESLSVSVPWSRVARVVLASDLTATTLSVEIAADRHTMGGELRDGQLNGLLRPAGYALTTAAAEDRSRLGAFAALLRRLYR